MLARESGCELLVTLCLGSIVRVRKKYENYVFLIWTFTEKDDNFINNILDEIRLILRFLCPFGMYTCTRGNDF
jgi:hypothetical protein